MCRGLSLDAPNGALVQPKSAKQQSSARTQQWDDDFLQFTYKIVSCDKTWRHDYATCPFSHPGESSERRHPSAYLPFMCGSTQHSTDLKEKCPFGTSCKYAHGHFELWLHPGRFRTKLCSLRGNCRRSVCFFAHSEAELRVTPYSKLDTAAAVAAQQLSQLAADGAVHSVTTSPCGSISAGSNVDGSDGGEVKAALANLSTPCESGMRVRSSPCASAAAGDGLASAFTTGMVLNQQPPALLEVQLQGNSNPALLAADAVSGAASTAPAMWLSGCSTGMLQQQMPAGNMAYGGVLPQRQLVYLDAATNAMGFTQGVAALPAAPGTEVMNGWMLAPNGAPAPAPAVNRLQDQWVANSMLAAAQQQHAAYGGLAGTAAGYNCAPAAAQMQGALSMPNMLGGSMVLDQWPQLENGGAYGGPSGLARPAMGCGLSVQRAAALQQQQQLGAAGAQQMCMAQLLSTLPDQAVQQLLAGMLAVDASSA
ncbi:hypothetical protein COO60DRAFT_1537054 [Scenedesmus sp. NREL 46B-D3]|nr:hypothetical protein COO60DRAFT_1537054 [Scenedesmus sp. NREL 46B-D3]